VTHYAYIFTDLRTSEPLAELPLSSVYVMDTQNDLGEFRADYHLDQTGYDNQTMLDATIPGRCGIVVEREGQPIWDGFITSRWYQSQAKSVSLYAKTIKSYPNHVYVDSTFEYEGVEQTQVFLNLWTLLQADITRNIQVALPAAIPTGVLKTETVHQYEFKTFGSVMDDLANGDNGFDWTVQTTKSSGSYTRTLLMGYPYLGEPFSDDSIVLDYPGSAVLNYYETENQIATHTFGQGAGSGIAMLQALNVDADQLSLGLRFDRTISFKDVNNQAILSSLTTQAFNQDKPSTGPSVFKLELKGDASPQFGDYNLGDYMYLYISDPRHSLALLKNVRLTRWELRPPESGGIEQTNLTFAGANLT
jgi:hypothetical protein